MQRLILFLFLVFLTCCSSVPNTVSSDADPLYKYQADMEITVDNVKFTGMAITKLEAKKLLTIRSKAKLDLLVITSCSRYVKYERVDYKTGWFGMGGQSAQTFQYTYEPNQKESEGVCPIYVQAFDMKGVTAWGYITWRTDETLPAQLDCNARTMNYAGHSICQVLSGTEQGIRFDTPIKKFEAEPNCNMVKDDDKNFTFRPGMGFCYATFFDGARWHRLTALGFERAQVRGEQ